eukprot:2308344-Prorocentrum_lima.AAC.1
MPLGHASPEGDVQRRHGTPIGWASCRARSFRRPNLADQQPRTRRHRDPEGRVDGALQLEANADRRRPRS